MKEAIAAAGPGETGQSPASWGAGGDSTEQPLAASRGQRKLCVPALEQRWGGQTGGQKWVPSQARPSLQDF